MAHGQYEAAATEAFKHIEEELKDLAGSGSFGARAIQEALGPSGVLAPAFERDQDREALRMLLLGAFDYYRNNLAHNSVFLEDPMHARELVLLCDLLLRELRQAAVDLRLRRLEERPATEREARASERELRALPPIEFQKWVVRRFSGTHSPRWSNDMGIDGYTPGHEWPIQAKQQEMVGRPVVDEFETAVERSGKSRGFLVAFGFSKGAQQEADRTRRGGRVDIDLVKVADLIRAVPS